MRPRTGRRTTRRVAVAAAAFLALTGAASYSAAMAAPSQSASRTAQPAWHIVKQVRNGPSGGFSAVLAVGKTGGWAFNQGAEPTAWRRTGSTWAQVRFPGQPNETVVAAGATSASDVWAFTAGGAPSRALRWNGCTWTVQRSFPEQIGGAAVISPSDVWVFGQPVFPGAGLGAWHFNGRTWSRVASGHRLQGGSALSANNIWAFDGSDIAHWNGSTWSRTSVSRLLPPKEELNGPLVTGVFAESKNSVYVIGNGGRQDDGGPLVILHWNGHQWSKVAEGNFGFGTQPLQQASSDGHGGLWIPMPGVDGQKSYLLHYMPRHPLSEVSLPGGPERITVETVTPIPGTADLLAGGNTHAYNNPGTNVVAVLLQYRS
ncbi:MAG: hypothetical protein M3Z75_20350 [Actinomycetota bacterium]|nr:hypothetical protein [Actinomycetota bacterium]